MKEVLLEGGSTFLNYHYFFYNYALQHPNIHFIIRPRMLHYLPMRSLKTT